MWKNSAEKRDKTAMHVYSIHCRKPLSKFFDNFLQDQCQQLCDVMIKKPDKKRERQILFGHRQQLAEQLVSCSDPALTLHLAAILLFQVRRGLRKRKP